MNELTIERMDDGEWGDLSSDSLAFGPGGNIYGNSSGGVSFCWSLNSRRELVLFYYGIMGEGFVNTLLIGSYEELNNLELETISVVLFDSAFVKGSSWF